MIIKKEEKLKHNTYWLSIETFFLKKKSHLSHRVNSQFKLDAKNY